MATTPSADVGLIDSDVGLEGHAVLDVRRATEHAERAVPGSLNVAHTRLSARIDELDPETTYVVHCRSGARVSAAVSYLERKGFQVKAVDDAFDNWRG